jgi:hypothetical protein
MTIHELVLAIAKEIAPQYGIDIRVDPRKVTWDGGRGIDGTTVAGAFLMPGNAYTDGPTIVMYSSGVEKAIEEGERARPGFSSDPNKIVRLIRRLIKHECRHFLQWSWLAVNGCAQLWPHLVQIPKYGADPLEHDANLYAVDKATTNLDEVMSAAIRNMLVTR